MGHNFGYKKKINMKTSKKVQTKRLYIFAPIGQNRLYLTLSFLVQAIQA